MNTKTVVEVRALSSPTNEVLLSIVCVAEESFSAVHTNQTVIRDSRPVEQK